MLSLDVSLRFLGSERNRSEKRRGWSRLMNGRIRICVLVSGLAFGLCGPAQSVMKKSNASPLSVVPFREMSGHIYIKGAIRGFRDLSMVIDTGASGSMLSETIYGQLNLPLIGMVNLPPSYGGGVTNPMPTTSIPTIGLGGFEIQNLPFIVIPDNFIPTMPGVETDAIIGSELFKRYVVEIDYSNKVLRLYDPSSYRQPQTGCKLPLHLGPMPSPLPLVHARIIAEGGRAVDAVLFLDTGGQIPMLTNSFTTAHPELLKNVPTHLEEADGIGGGITRFRVGRVPAIQLGACAVRDPLVAFSQDTEGMGQGGSFFSGQIGLTVFRRFTTIFDYQGGFVIFESNTTSGLSGAH